MISTKRLKLAPINICYSKDIFNLWSDYDVIKYTNINLMTTYEECDEKIHFRINNQTDWSYPNNLVVLLNNKVIGVAGFPVMNQNKSEYGFYYQFLKEHWGNGYALETAEALLKYIFEGHPNATVFAGSVSINLASIKILNKLGFVQTGIDKEGFKGFDLIHFRYTK